MAGNGHGHYRISRKAHLSPESGGDPLWNEARVFSRWEAWTDLIQLAAWGDHERMVDGKLTKIGRGEVCASLRFLARRWSWSKSKVQRFLALMEKMERIAGQSRDGQRDTYLLVNYDAYQSGRDSGETLNGTSAGQRRDSGETKRKKKKEGIRKDKEQPTLVGLPADAGAVSSNGAGQVKEVWAAYLEALDAYRRGKNGGKSKPPVFSDKRAALIKKQLKTYPVDDLKAAVQGVFLSPYHCGENQDGTEYLTLEIALSVNRQRTNVEKFRDLHLRGGPPQQRTPTRSHGMGGTSKLMEDARRIDAQEGW